MCPHPQNLHNPLLLMDFVHQTVLLVDSARIIARQIPHQLLVRRLIGILYQNIEQLLRFTLQTC